MCGGCNTSQVTNTPNPTASAAYDSTIAQAQGVAATPYQPYAGEQVAGLNGGQTAAIGQLEGAYGTARPFFNGATNYLGSAAAGLGNVQNYLQAGSQAAAGVGAAQGAAGNQFGQSNALIGQASQATGQIQPYQDMAQGAYGQAQGYAGQAAGSYGQMQAGLGQVGSYLGRADGYFGQAAGLATPQDFTGADGVSKYMNPYTQSVIDATMATARQNDAIQTAGLTSNAIGSGAYGGDRNGIAQATLAGQQDMANNSTIAGLNQANYGQATAQFNATQAQRQAGAGLYTGLGQGELQAGGLRLNTAAGYGQAGQGYAGLGSLANATGAGYTGLGQLQGQAAQEYGNLASASNATGSGYLSSGQLGLGVAGQYGQFGALQGTTGASFGTLGSLAGNIGTQAQGAAVSGASAGLQGATLQQQTQQAQDTAAYQQYQNQIQYPFNTTGWLSNIVQGIGSQQGGSSTTQGSALSGIVGGGVAGLGILGATGNGGILSGGISSVGNALTGLNSGVVSDERMKDDIAEIGRTFDGQPLYRFRYKGDSTVHTGLMAQDVEKRDPGAVGSLGNIKTVDYDRATRGAAERGRFADGGGLGNVARVLAAPGAIRPRFDAGVGVARPQFDDGGTVGVGSDYLSSGSFAQDLAHNPLISGRSGVGGAQSTLPGGNFQRMPGGDFQRMPSASASKQGLGALTSDPSLTASPAGGVGSASAGSASASDASDSSSGGFGKNASMALIAAGLGMMGGTSMSAAANIGQGGLEGLKTYMGLQQQDRQNAVTQAELAAKVRQTQIDQQRADQNAQQIANEAAFQRGSLANSTAETGVRQSTAASENASRDQAAKIGRYSTSYVPGIGYVIRDLTNPTAPPQVSPVDPSSSVPAAASAASGPISFGGPADAASAPSALPAAPIGGQPRAAAPSQPQPAAMPSVAPNAVQSQPQPTPAQPSSAAWKPTTAVPPSYLPPNHMAIYQNPSVLKGEQENATKTIEAVRGESQAAGGLQMRLDEMDRQYAQLPKTSILAPGAAATARADIAKGINTFAATLGAAPPFDPNALAANENLLKDRFRLGADLAKSMGGREPGYIVEQAVKANPGADNTPLAYQRITAGLRQASQYQQDRAAFFDDYNARFGHLNGAQQAFDRMNPPDRYADRAVISTVDPRDVGALQQNARNPEAAAAIDRKYGVGTSAIIMRQ